MRPNLQETADLVTFIGKILNGKRHFLYSVCYVNSWLEIILNHLLSMNKRFEYKAHQLYSKKLRKFCKKEDQSQFQQSHQKFMFWSKFCTYLVQTFLKILCWRFTVPRSERLLVRSPILSCKTWNISTLPVLLYYKTNSFCPI